jgi:hypothetical protein
LPETTRTRDEFAVVHRPVQVAVRLEYRQEHLEARRAQHRRQVRTAGLRSDRGVGRDDRDVPQVGDQPGEERRVGEDPVGRGNGPPTREVLDTDRLLHGHGVVCIHTVQSARSAGAANRT